MKITGILFLVALFSVSSFAQDISTKGAILDTQTSFGKCLVGITDPTLKAQGKEFVSFSVGGISADKKEASVILLVQNRCSGSFISLGLIVSTTDPKGWQYNQVNSEVGFIARSNVETNVRLVSIDSNSGAVADLEMIDASACLK